MGNYSSSTTTTTTTQGETRVNKKTGETIVKFNLFPKEDISNSDDLIESSQVDHFSSEQRIEELKELIGEEYVNNKIQERERMEDMFLECEPLSETKDHKEFDGVYRGLLYINCMMRKYSEFQKQAQKQRKKCIESEYLDEMLDIKGLLRRNSSNQLRQKLDEFVQDFGYCLSKEDSSENHLMQEIMGFLVKTNEPYTGILNNPERIKLLKSRYLPKETRIEKKKIEPELMEPYIYNPNSDSDEDFGRKLSNLSQTDFLKHDIELVKECYQNDSSKSSAKCLTLYNQVMNAASVIVCKKEILVSCPPRIFPNIEDASLTDLAVEGKCMKSLMKEHAGKLLPNMPEFETAYFFDISKDLPDMDA